MSNVQTLPVTPIAHEERTQRVIIRDLIIQAQIGVFDHEQGRTQRVRINLDVDVDSAPPQHDQLDEVLCYQLLIDQITALITTRHINLVESLADLILDLAMAQPTALTAHVRVEKLEAVANAASVGVEMSRRRVFPGRV